MRSAIMARHGYSRYTAHMASSMATFCTRITSMELGLGNLEYITAT